VRSVRKGAADAVRRYVRARGKFPDAVMQAVDDVARAGSTPLVVAAIARPEAVRVLGVIELKDIVKGGIRERFAELRRWASDGDDHRRQPADRRAIAAEAGVDDFLAEATPEAKLR
jgi:K+-transporting ATPase ATPase B chain